MRFTNNFALIVVGYGMIAVVGVALLFEHWGGYVPCYLCLLQRIPYYVAIPIAFFGLIMQRNTITYFCLIAVLCAMMSTIGMGVYHSGVEWGLWQGPTACSVVASGGTSDASTLLSQLSQSKPPSCNDAAGRFLFLSFAGWNVIAGLLLSIIAFAGMRRTAN